MSVQRPPWPPAKYKRFAAKAALTTREILILRRMAEDCPQKIIRAELGIGRTRLSQLLMALYRKLGAADRLQACLWFVLSPRDAITRDDGRRSRGPAKHLFVRRDR